VAAASPDCPDLARITPVPTVPRRRSASSGHLVVCGDSSLAFRIIEELTTRYAEDVTVIMPSKERNHGPRIAQLPNVRIIERTTLTDEAFRDARVGSARALALLQQDDVGNLHGALRAQELNADLRIVLHIFNTRLGERVRTFFHDCAVLSGSAVAAPSFVAAANSASRSSSCSRYSSAASCCWPRRAATPGPTRRT